MQSPETLNVGEPAVPDHAAVRTTSAPELVVCIPTHRRPAQLSALLAGLTRQRSSIPFGVVVGNNAPDDVATNDVLAACDLPDLRVVPVAERGVVAVRNAMLDAVLARDPSPRWIACIDDDQMPDDDWLVQLVAVAVRHAADVVGGPVVQVAAIDTRWSAAATDTSYLPRREGPVPALNEAGNLLFSVPFLEQARRPAFSGRFGLSGGEDYEFFLYASSVRARIVWAPDARVVEVIPAARLSLRGLLWRAYSTGASQAIADRLYTGRGAVVSSIVMAAVKAPMRLVVSFIRTGRLTKPFGIFLRAAATVAGRTAGLLGARAHRYGGSAPLLDGDVSSTGHDA